MQEVIGSIPLCSTKETLLIFSGVSLFGLGGDGGFYSPAATRHPLSEGEACRGAVVGRELRHESAVLSGWAFWALLPRRLALPPLERGIKGE